MLRRRRMESIGRALDFSGLGSDHLRLFATDNCQRMESWREYWDWTNGGIDFGLNQAGPAIRFQDNAAMGVAKPDGAPRCDCRREAVGCMHTAVRDLLLGRAGDIPKTMPAAVNGPAAGREGVTSSCSRWSSRNSCIGNSCHCEPCWRRRYGSWVRRPCRG